MINETKTQTLSAVEVNPKSGSPKYTLIWMHGLGADAEDFVPMIEELKTEKTKNIRFIFPNAPMRPVTINDGMVMQAWFDIKDLEFTKNEDSHGILKSQNLIAKLIENENKRGIASNKIILGGFSQGGAMALHTGLRHKDKLKGVISLSAYLPMQESFIDSTNNFKDLNIFIAHGIFDPIVPFMHGKECHESLNDYGYNIDWHTYPIQHTVSQEELLDIGKFLNKIC